MSTPRLADIACIGQIHRIGIEGEQGVKDVCIAQGLEKTRSVDIGKHPRIQVVQGLALRECFWSIGGRWLAGFSINQVEAVCGSSHPGIPGGGCRERPESGSAMATVETPLRSPGEEAFLIVFLFRSVGCVPSARDSSHPAPSCGNGVRRSNSPSSERTNPAVARQRRTESWR